MASAAQEIDLKILSPSSEVTGEILIPSLPASTTVGDLKLKIQDSVDSRPSVDRMRLIYRGRVVATDADTMTDVFGREAIQQNHEVILHLVLREVHSHLPPATSSASTASRPAPPSESAPRASTVPPLAPNPFRAAMIPPIPTQASTASSPTNPALAALGGPRSQSQPSLSSAAAQQQHQGVQQQPTGPQIPYPHPGLPVGIPTVFAPMQAPHYAQLPPDVNQIINQHITHAQLLAHANPQQYQTHQYQNPYPHPQPHHHHHHHGHHHHHAPMHNNIHSPSASQPAQVPPNATQGPPNAPQVASHDGRSQNDFIQLIANLEQERAAAGSRQGTIPNAAVDGGQFGQIPTPQTSRPHSPHVMGTYSRDVVAPNGHRYRVNVTTGLGQPPTDPLNQHRFQMQQQFQAGMPGLGRSASPVPGFGIQRPQSDSDRDISRIRANLTQAQREVENLRHLVLTPTPGESSIGPTAPMPPLHRVDEVRIHLTNLNRNLDLVQSTLNQMVANPAYSRSRDVVSLQMLNNSLRSQAGELSQNLGRQSLTPQVSYSDLRQASSQREASAQSSPLPSPGPSHTAPQPEMFMLSGPEGPYGLVYTPSGTYTTSPLPADGANPLLSHQRNIDTLEQLHTQYVLGAQQLSNSLQRIQPVPEQTLGAYARSFPRIVLMPTPTTPQDIPQPQGEAQADNQPQPAQAGQPRANGELINANEPINVMFAFANIWLFVKLVAVIWLLSYGAGWRRGLLVGTMGAIVFLAQVGVFGDTLQRARRHIEALLPIPEDLRAPRDGANGQRAPQRDGQPVNSLTNHIPTPAGTAGRLIRERQEQQAGILWSSVRAMERAVLLFIASLMPGMGERMVRVREERDRLEREEQERQEQEREAASQAHSDNSGAKPPTEAVDSSVDGTAPAADDSPVSSKGKERALEQENNSGGPHHQGEASSS